MMQRRRRLVLGGLSALLLAGCQINGEPLREDARVLRLILVPVPDSGLDPASSEGLDRLSRAAGTELVHVRPMSGGGHVLATAEPVPVSQAETILQRLAADPAIAYAEEDRRVTHQSPE
ncbi:hypothetical protein Tgr7_0228 [Thioalkalivibrio sulfidiphilus HL-EbGr7]|uniref:Lipoprotein n=1 Tax=Thioalkalivibrio sulfidiphilus (strain HL-EbGR7) TaxID=396588 RepID=B8GU44_THISH|nr:hypothetical protein [Thioalkalivibrio sulfidiphilus]ACL71327.1 hypothetical protein Tgr7_0228 [Thioalkalivibrio sulfidiphilus HL-EbGr7]